ncbi:MAG TPA: slipin family protein [Polyangiaceae bacterium LLY-WYZ-15_(1-7)]|nr:slipin family protein [Polyangiaceae bacterium LLY-WYZ-15_(1-7)]HJL10695.1 slipin family protein [Polyangiaceae bacterium LLY-WYZ-15_(1-7)]HJL35469.1 slipin family protein [Polyangiaceae bacterium LLY-WYZ-15_(1-7)]HJL44351.1 slipin family protein [Polyangiaceae bacterium LLY-WYZ-15_(1-7)]
MSHFVVPNAHVGLLYVDGVYEDALPPGRHPLGGGLFDRKVRRVDLVDLRERSLVIKGQEILTRDKVAIRVSLLVYFEVVDPVAAKHHVADYEARIYEDVQLAARRFLASRDLDAILSDRNEISDAVRETVKDAAQGYGVEIHRADVKDLVFPGNLKTIMNQVLETERRAEAKLIQQRKDIEARKLAARADEEAQRRRLEAERERLHLELEAEKERSAAELERQRVALRAEVEQAEALAAHPALLKLRQLETLATMARSGGRFVVGLKDLELLEDER